MMYYMKFLTALFTAYLQHIYKIYKRFMTYMNEFICRFYYSGIYYGSIWLYIGIIK
jgi:hypothetical protein